MQSTPSSAAWGEQYVGNIDVPKWDALDLYIETMASQMRAHICALDLILLARFVGDDDDLDASGPLQKRHGIADRPRRRPAAIPADHHTVELERRLLSVTNYDERPAGVEQRGFDNDPLDRIGPRLRLTDYREIEAPRDPAELLTRADQACAERQRTRP